MLQNNRVNEQGSALVYVFIGLALFAALLFTFSKSSLNSTATSTAGNGKIMANYIMDRGSKIETAVSKLLLKGCSISELNFYSNHFTQTGSANPGAPADGRCDVYSPKGGNIQWQPCPDSSLCTDPYLYAPMVPRSISIPNLGTLPQDLVYVVLVRKEVCLEINKALNLPTTNLAETSIDNPVYTGTFTFNNQLPLTGAGDYLPFQKSSSGCIYARNYMTAWGGEFFFYYHVLVAL